jgi:hypothetical protein
VLECVLELALSSGVTLGLLDLLVFSTFAVPSSTKEEPSSAWVVPLSEMGSPAFIMLEHHTDWFPQSSLAASDGVCSTRLALGASLSLAPSPHQALSPDLYSAAQLPLPAQQPPTVPRSTVRRAKPTRRHPKSNHDSRARVLSRARALTHECSGGRCAIFNSHYRIRLK